MYELKKLDNGFEYIEVINDISCASIALQGAHIFHYALRDEDKLLWLSEESDFEQGKSIRGGVPICWPSFGMNNPNLPQHGFARTAMWELESARDIHSGATQVTLKLNDTKESLKLWGHKFELRLSVTISDKLIMELTTINTDEKPFRITQALHTYFQISHISNITVEGLDSKACFDALRSKNSVQRGDIRFEGEYDRVFQGVDSEIFLKDKNRTITIKNEGSSSAVVWNPWIEKSKRMSGMSESAYENFVCIESANAFEDFKIINPGERDTLKTVIY